MKTLRKMKKGFTIVELVIVIAVIAILTAILVPTFISISNKADKASDQSLKNYLNKALAIVENDKELNKNGDNKGKTMHFAVEDLDEYGITLDKIVTKSDEKLVWNSADNRFYFESEAPAVVAERYGYWRIQTNGNDADGYAIYAGKNFAETNGVVNVCVGFDAGYNEDIKEINYTSISSQKRTVAIRSNGTSTTLTVNAPLDTVHHYDYLDELTVTAVDPDNSYHEHGTVKGKAAIAKGHFVIEDNGSVDTIVVTSDNAADVSIDLTKTTVDTAPTVYAENETVAAALDTMIDGSADVKESSIQTATYTKHVKTVSELSTALNENGYVILDNDLEASSPVWIAEFVGTTPYFTDHEVVLDLNEYSITTTTSFEGRPIMNCGVLTITGNGKISSENAGDGGYGAVRNYNSLTIENGTFLGNPIGGGSAIDNMQGELVINDGWFGGTGSLNNRDNGVAVINGGTFYSEACSKLPNSAWCYALRSSGKLTLNNAVVRGAQGGVAIYGGEAVINNVDSKTIACGSTDGLIADHSTHGDVSYYALYVAGESTTTTCTVYGGTFESTKLSPVYIGNNAAGDGGNRQKAELTLHGGTFISKEGVSVIKVDRVLGFAYIYGGRFSNNNVTVGDAKKTLSDISSKDVTIVEEGGWYIAR